MPERAPNSKAARDGAANGKGCDVDRITCRRDRGAGLRRRGHLISDPRSNLRWSGRGAIGSGQVSFRGHAFRGRASCGAGEVGAARQSVDLQKLV